MRTVRPWRRANGAGLCNSNTDTVPLLPAAEELISLALMFNNIFRNWSVCKFRNYFRAGCMNEYQSKVKQHLTLVSSYLLTYKME